MERKHLQRWWPAIAVSAVVLAGVVGSQYFTDGVVRDFFGRAATARAEGVVMSQQNVAQAIEHVDARNFVQKVLESDVPVMVDFYADWCGPCRALKPLLEEVARETPHAKIVKVNVDESPELANHFRIESIPSLLVFRDGRLSDRHSGVPSRSVLRRLLAPRPVADEKRIVGG